MAQLTYNLETGELVALSDLGSGATIIASAISGGSNLFWHSSQRQVGKHGSQGHIHGGPIPLGDWSLHIPGTQHPDGGNLRPDWIPVGPVRGRTHIYIHPAGTLTEGCIAVTDHEKYEQIRELVEAESGGVLHVVQGDIV